MFDVQCVVCDCCRFILVQTIQHTHQYQVTPYLHISKLSQIAWLQYVSNIYNCMSFLNLVLQIFIICTLKTNYDSKYIILNAMQLSSLDFCKGKNIKLFNVKNRL